MATPYLVFTSGKKKKKKKKKKKGAKNSTSARQILGAINLKLGMHTQLDFGSNMGWFSCGHTFSYWCVYG